MINDVYSLKRIPTLVSSRQMDPNGWFLKESKIDGYP